MSTRSLLNLLAFFFGDYLARRAPGNRVLIRLRGSMLDSDTMPLLQQAVASPSIERVFLIVEDKQCLARVNGWFMEGMESRLQVLEEHERSVVDAMLSCSVVVLTTAGDFLGYRLCARAGARSFVRIYHGIITKAYRRLMQGSEARQGNGVLASLCSGHALGGLRVDAQSVESDVERFFRISAECGKPRFYKLYGYPRYDRAAQLAAGTGEPWLPDRGAELVDAARGKFRILYAPTHKDGVQASNLFPVSGFDIDRFRAFLRERQAVVFLRMHLLEMPGLVDELVDDEVIFSADSMASSSALELLPAIDLLITDYSSIYMDFLPFDRPILFVRDDFAAFARIRGLAFDYDLYFPGAKIDTYSQLVGALEEAMAGKDPHQDDRRLVSRVLIPPREKTFFEQAVLPRLEGSANAGAGSRGAGR